MLRMTRGRLALAVAMLALAGCTSELGPSAGFNAPDSVGALPADYKTVAAEWVRASLNDPSRPVTVLPASPNVAACNISVLGRHFGWRVPVRYSVSADEGCGDCNGEKTVYLWFSGGKVERRSYFPDQC